VVSTGQTAASTGSSAASRASVSEGPHRLAPDTAPPVPYNYRSQQLSLLASHASGALVHGAS
jgi:hypothetical protein